MKLVQLVGAATRRQELKHQGKYRTLNTTEKYFRNTEKLKKFTATNTRLRLHLLESNCYVQRRKWRDAAQRRVRSDRRLGRRVAGSGAGRRHERRHAARADEDLLRLGRRAQLP